jgi:transposase
LKNGRTALAYEAEHTVDMDTGAIVAVTTHGGAEGDTTSVGETLPAAGEAIAEHIAESTTNGKFEVNAKGLEELVADKGYHSGNVLVDLQGLEVRTYIAEPDRGRRKWVGKRAEQAAVYGNRQRVGRDRGKQLLRRRGELVERTFACLRDRSSTAIVRTRKRERAQARSAASGRVQLGAAAPEDGWSGDAASNAGRSGTSIACSFAGYLGHGRSQ